MELDIEDFETLRLYLAQHIHRRHPVAFSKLPGGVSNRPSFANDDLMRVCETEDAAWQRQPESRPARPVK